MCSIESPLARTAGQRRCTSITRQARSGRSSWSQVTGSSSSSSRNNISISNRQRWGLLKKSRQHVTRWRARLFGTASEEIQTAYTAAGHPLATRYHSQPAIISGQGAQTGHAWPENSAAKVAQGQPPVFAADQPAAAIRPTEHPQNRG